MTTYCNEGGKTHMWAYPEFPDAKNIARVCMFCKVSQTKCWKNDKKNGEEAQDDTGFEELV